MNELQKKRMRSSFKYTWPFYILGAIIAVICLNIAFSLTHKVPDYKSLTLFVTGEVNEPKKLRKDMLEKFQDKELKTFSCISAKESDGNFSQKLTIAGYSSADLFILTESKLNKLIVSDFALELKDELISSYYQGYTLYSKDDVKYGIKINKEIVKDYMTLPEEDCYLVFNGKSVNTGEYSPKQIKEHDMALSLVKDWGM